VSCETFEKISIWSMSLAAACRMRTIKKPRTVKCEALFEIVVDKEAGSLFYGLAS